MVCIQARRLLPGGQLKIQPSRINLETIMIVCWDGNSVETIMALTTVDVFIACFDSEWNQPVVKERRVS